MLAIAFVVAVVFIVGLGLVLQWWARREPSGTPAEVGKNVP